MNLCVDRANGVQAFSRWTFTDKPISICSMQIGGDEKLFAIMQNSNGNYLATFNTEDTTYSDCGYSNGTLTDHVNGYTSKMKANPYDSMLQDGSVTFGDAKSVSKMLFRCVDTGHVVTYFNEKDKTTTRTPICCDSSGSYIGGLADHSVNVNGGTTRDLMITVESVDDEPMTLLAMAYDLRVNRNG